MTISNVLVNEYIARIITYIFWSCEILMRSLIIFSRVYYDKPLNNGVFKVCHHKDNHDK
jgi:hypothetical protein